MTLSLHVSPALVADATRPTKRVKVRRLVKMAGAAALSIGMVGTFAMPAYATAAPVDGAPDGYQAAPAQSMTTPGAEGVDASGALEAPSVALDTDAVEAEEAAARAEAEAAARAEADAARAAEADAAAEQPAQQLGADVPAGEGAQGIVAAARAQLGQYQDCTALVERSLRAVGIPAGDLGTSAGEYTALGGTLVTSGDFAPGDILIWAGRHVAVYIGNGQAVHGGWSGNNTVISGVNEPSVGGMPTSVVRF